MLAPDHCEIGKPCETCSAMKWPKTENLLVKLWSMRTISSLRLVGAVAAPLKMLPEVGAGKIPAFSKAVAFPLIMHEGMTLPGKWPPWTTPAGAAPPGQFANKTPGDTCAAVGTLIGVASLLKLPP